MSPGGKGEDRMSGLVLEMSAECQLNCPLCFLRSYQERPARRFMSMEVLGAVLPYVSGLDSIDLTGWGEPLLHPRLFDLVAALRREFSGRLSMTTNGQLLDSESMGKIIHYGMDTVCISVDAATEGGYEAVRPGGSFMKIRRVLDGFTSLRKEAGVDKPRLFATFLLRADALAEVPEFVSMVSGHGLDGAVFQQMTGVFDDKGLARVTHCDYYYNSFDPSALADAMERAMEQAPEGFVMVCPEKIGPKRVGGCGGFDLSRAFVTPGGDVSACCAMAYPCSLMRRDRRVEKTEAVTFGNVLEKPLPLIWRSDDYRRTREEIRSGRVPGACGECIALYMTPGEVWTCPAPS